MVFKVALSDEDTTKRLLTTAEKGDPERIVVHVEELVVTNFWIFQDVNQRLHSLKNIN